MDATLRLTPQGICSYFVLMQIETLNDAWAHGGRVWMACAFGPYTKGMKRGRECNYRQDLDLRTLIATRGGAFPVSMLAQRLKCPACGSRVLRVVWSFPPRSNEGRVAALG